MKLLFVNFFTFRLGQRNSEYESKIGSKQICNIFKPFSRATITPVVDPINIEINSASCSLENFSGYLLIIFSISFLILF